ncbi:MAG: PIG-L family deacetylase, partial [Spirochaetia bacterium]
PVFAFGCHPDDIEFLMSGTLFLLREAGAEIHYMNPANGCLGTAEYSKEEIIDKRRRESMEAAEYLGAVFHESIAGDMEIRYTPELLARVTARIREIQPDILLLLSLEDYMEDHMNAARLGYTAAFCRGMTNYITDPPRDAVGKEIAVYHVMPYGLRDMMDRPVTPDFFINVEGVMDKKREMLALHASQKTWLDVSQGMDAYLESMQDMTAEMGSLSGSFRYAEGFRRHNPLGFCSPDYTPLENALKEFFHKP